MRPNFISIDSVKNIACAGQEIDKLGEKKASIDISGLSVI